MHPLRKWLYLLLYRKEAYTWEVTLYVPSSLNPKYTEVRIYDVYGMSFKSCLHEVENLVYQLDAKKYKIR
jgi:hypothetical protein